MTSKPNTTAGGQVSASMVIDSSFAASGIAELSHVYDLGLAVGLPEQTVRLAIRRRERTGYLRQEGRGRGGRLVLTSQGSAGALGDARLIELAFAQDVGAVFWDRSWHMYTFNVPESHRTERDALRNSLTILGAVALSPGTYFSPHDLRSELIRSLPRQLVDERITQATVSRLNVPGCANDLEIAERFWPAKETIEAYEPLETHLNQTREKRPVGGPTAIVAAALQLAGRFEHALKADPLLPSELRPSPWAPASTRARFLEAWSDLRAGAPEAPIFYEHIETRATQP